MTLAADGGSTVDRGVFAVLLVAVLTLCYLKLQVIDGPQAAVRVSWHRAVIAGHAAAPNNNRVLAPCLAEPGIVALTPTLGPAGATLLVYGVLEAALLVWFVLGLFVYLRAWWPRDTALLLVLLATGGSSLAMLQQGSHTSSFLEAALLTWGLVLNRQGHRAAVATLAVIGALNRETAALLPLACLLTSGALPDQAARRAARLWAGAALLAVGAVMLVLHVTRTAEPPVMTTAQIWQHNLAWPNWVAGVCQSGLMVGLVVAAALAGVRAAPREAQLAAWVALPYLGAYLCCGVWYEVRLLLDLYPLLLPLAAGVLAAPAVTSARSASPAPPS